MSGRGGTLFIQPAPKVEQPSGPAVLVFIAPPGPMLGKRFELQSGELIVGRADEVEVSCRADGVSRRHARLACGEGGAWTVSDLGSTNGTFVNDERVTGVRTLRDGDALQFGTATAKFLSGSSTEARYHEEIYRMTVMDALTGVHNKRFFLEFLGREVPTAQRRQAPLSLLMFDVDHFKKVNDVHGHLAGDAVLREVGRRIKPHVRPVDLIARYGGEEFGIVLLDTPLAHAAAYAENVRATIAGQPFACGEGLELPVTVSVGVAELLPTSPAEPEDLIRRADEHLYAAKRGGRNRVVAA